LPPAAGLLDDEEDDEEEPDEAHRTGSDGMAETGRKVCIGRTAAAAADERTMGSRRADDHASERTDTSGAERGRPLRAGISERIGRRYIPWRGTTRRRRASELVPDHVGRQTDGR
jgi:hypothetical protein